MSDNRGRRQNSRSSRGATEIAQFIPVLYILFLLVLVPLLDLVNLLVAGTTQYLATNDFAAKAATQSDYTSALNSMANEAYQFQSNGLARFVNMLPQGGYVGCGDDLYVLVTNVNSGTVAGSPANQPLTQAINSTTNMYELQVKSDYSVSPLLSLSALPVLGSVPGLGKPVTLTFTANRPVEHPGGFQPAPSGSVSSSAGVTPFARVGTNTGVAPPPTNVTWRDPGIFQQIANAGESVVSVTVVTVECDNPNWTPSGVQIKPGEKIWIDTQAVGQWWTPGLPVRDANGIPNDPGCPGVECPSANFNSLVGVIGVTGPIKANTPNSFFLGNQQYNYPPNGTGMFSMANNNWGFGAVGDMAYGAQLVRVIVVQ